MKKVFRKSITLGVSAIMCATMTFGFTGCSLYEQEGEAVDATKTQLHVSNYNGGWGTEWLYNAKDRFEDMFADYQFEDGKTGVQIHVNPNRNDVNTTIRSSTDNIFFSGDIRINDLITQGLVADISDIVTDETLADVSDGKETGKISDKMYDSDKASLTGVDGKYYALPHNRSFAGLTYDAKLFAEKRYYLKANADGSWNGSTNNAGFTNVDADKTVGPNGIRGDYDDGLPSTLAEQIALFNRIAAVGDEPLIWPGRHTWYVTHLSTALWASLAGPDGVRSAFDFGSTGTDEQNTIEVVTGFDGNTPTTESKRITPATGYLTTQTSARYYATKQMYDILSNSDKYLSKKWTGVLCHTETQYEYVYSDLESAKTGHSIAMLVDGNWWYNEASDSFKSSVDRFKEDAENRNFKIMPMPWKVDGGVKEGEGKAPTLVADNTDLCIVKAANTKGGVLDAAKKFIKFLYTDAECVEFETTTGTPKGVKYEMSPEKYNSMNVYYKSVHDLVKAANVVTSASGHPIYVNNQSDFSPLRTYVIGSGNSDFPYSQFINKETTAKSWFEGMNRESAWASKYEDYIS